MLFRIVGGGLIILGLILCITIIGATIGVPMILIGALLYFVGRKSRPIIIQVQKDSRDQH